MGPILPGGVFRLDPPTPQVSLPDIHPLQRDFQCDRGCTNGYTALLSCLELISNSLQIYRRSKKALFLQPLNLHLGIFFEGPPKLTTEIALLWIHNQRLSVSRRCL